MKLIRSSDPHIDRQRARISNTLVLGVITYFVARFLTGFVALGDVASVMIPVGLGAVASTGFLLWSRRA